MSEWPVALLGSVTEKIGSGATPRGGEAVYRQSGIALIRSQNVLDNSMRTTDIARISDEAAESLKSVAVSEHDVLINITGDSVARCSLVDPTVLPARVNQHVAIIRPGKSLDSRYLQKVLVNPAFKQRLLTIATGGGTRNALTKAQLGALDIPLPPLQEQQAIAEVLGALDDKIAANTALAATVDDYLATRFSQVFDSYDERVRLRDIAEVNQAKIKPIPGGKLRYVDISSVGVGSFEYPPAIAWADAPGRARRKLQRGDTMWSTVRPNRRSHALNLSADPLLVASTGLAVLTPKTVGFAYLYEATKRAEFSAYLENVAEGSAYPAVKADRFLDAPVPAADHADIADFERIAAPLRESVFAASEENRALAATRDALLPQLMSGKLRVRDAERIASEAGA